MIGLWEMKLLKCAKVDQDKVNYLKIALDGKLLQNLQSFRVQSPLFNITFPENNAAGTQAGTTQVSL